LLAKIMLEYLASLSRERLLALVRELQQQMTLLQRQVTEMAASNDALRAEIDQLKRGNKRQATPSTWTHGSQRFLPCQEHAVGPPELDFCPFKPYAGVKGWEKGLFMVK
jgi:hypothetical protein